MPDELMQAAIQAVTDCYVGPWGDEEFKSLQKMRSDLVRGRERPSNAHRMVAELHRRYRAHILGTLNSPWERRKWTAADDPGLTDYLPSEARRE